MTRRCSRCCSHGQVQRWGPEAESGLDVCWIENIQMEGNEWMSDVETTWKTTQKNQARRMYPGTSQASFLLFSSLSQIRMLAVLNDSRREVEGGLESSSSRLSRAAAGGGRSGEQQQPLASTLASTNHWSRPSPTQNHHLHLKSSSTISCIVSITTCEIATNFIFFFRSNNYIPTLAPTSYWSW